MSGVTGKSMSKGSQITYIILASNIFCWLIWEDLHLMKIQYEIFNLTRNQELSSFFFQSKEQDGYQHDNREKTQFKVNLQSNVSYNNR